MNAQRIRASYGISIASVLLLAFAGGSCTRSDPSAAAQILTKSQSAIENQNGAERTSPLALKPSSAGAPKLPAVQAAASLAGHDRFLVAGEGPPVAAADFLIGQLAPSLADARLAPFSLLRAGLKEQELDPRAFSRNSGRITALVFGQAYAAARATELRVGLPQALEGGIALSFRLLGTDVSAIGQAILSSDERGVWLIEHFELDREGLTLPRTRNEAWEPPLALYP